MANDILVKQDGPILRITLNAPKRGNAVTDDMVRELTKLIREAPKKSDIVVLRGAGKDFCVGRAGMGARPAVEPTAYARRKFSDVVFDAYGAMRNCPIPIVAVVQGGAHGFGCAIAAACDITIASDKASFSVPEMAHQIMPTMVMSSFVDRVPRKAMAYLVYSMFEVSPERALSYGIVSDVVPAAQARRPRRQAHRGDAEGAVDLAAAAPRSTSAPRPTCRSPARSNTPATCTPPSIRRRNPKAARNERLTRIVHSVMAGLVPAIHVLLDGQDVDARHKSGHDVGRCRRTHIQDPQ